MPQTLTVHGHVRTTTVIKQLIYATTVNDDLIVAWFNQQQLQHLIYDLIKMALS